MAPRRDFACCPPLGRQGTPRTLIEAAACGRALIVTDGAGGGSFVRDGVEGLVVPRGDVAALAEALERLARDADLRARLGEAARLRVLQGFTEAHVKEALRRRLSVAARPLCSGVEPLRDRLNRAPPAQRVILGLACTRTCSECPGGSHPSAGSGVLGALDPRNTCTAVRFRSAVSRILGDVTRTKPRSQRDGTRYPLPLEGGGRKCHGLRLPIASLASNTTGRLSPMAFQVGVSRRL